MALRPFLSAADHAALPDALRTEYRQDGERYVLDVTREGGFELANTAGLLASVQATRAERDRIEGELREMRTRFPQDLNLDELRADSARLRQLLAQGDPDERLRTELEARQRLINEQAAQREAALREEHARALREREQRTGQLEDLLDHTTFENAATRAIQSVDPGAAARFLLPEIQGRTRIVRGEDGRRVVEVLDQAGQVRYESVDGQARPMGLEALVRELQSHPEFGRAFTGGSATGSGANPHSGTGGPGDHRNPFDRSGGHFSLTEQARILRENPNEAARLRDLAPPMQRQSMLPKPG